VASIKDPNMVPVYSKKLVMEYGRLLPILGLNCLQEGEIQKIIKDVKESKA